MDDKIIINRVSDCETVNYKDLKVIQGELKDLTKDKYTRFKRQIKKNGITSPVHVWDDNGVLKVLDGTQRKRLYGAMEEEGYLIPPVPIVRITADSEKQAKNILLGLASQYGEVNSDGLYAFALEAEVDFDELKSDFAFPEINFNKFEKEYAPEVEGNTEDDAVPDEAPARCALGDIWKLGNHRLMCGDSTDKETVLKLMDGDKADITFTSPPYNIGRSKGGSKGHIKYKNYADDLSDPEYLALLTNFLDQASAHTKYQFINLQFLECNRVAIITWLFNLKEHLKEVMVWYKKHGSITPDYVLHSAYENIFVFDTEFVKSRAIKLNNPLKGTTNVIERDQNMIQHENHKAGFPVYLPEWIIKNFEPKSVYEPFSGTGTTIIACEKNGIKSFALELDPKYCDIAIKRWEDFTGQTAVKIETDKPILRKASKRG